MMMKNYEDSRDKLTVCLGNADHLPVGVKAYKTFWGMPVYFRVRETDDTSVCVTEHLRMDWGVSWETIYTDALNADLKRGYLVRSLDLVLGIPVTCPMLVVTTNDFQYGASAMLHDTILQNIYATIKQPYFILPSSRHEVLAYPDNGSFTATELRKMVSDVNLGFVEPQDVISDNVFYYDGTLREA